MTLRTLPTETLRLSLIALALWPIIALCGCARAPLDQPEIGMEPADAPVMAPGRLTKPIWI